MSWASPLAWLIAAGVIGPLAAHLLSRRPPTRHVFPTLRFVRATATSARRLRTLHDPWLWLWRTLTVIVIAGAAAGPTLTTAARLARWEAPVQVAIVTAPHPPAQHVEQPASMAEGDPPDAWYYTTRSVRMSLAAAIDDLASVPARRRRIVVRWNGDVRVFAPEDAAAIPSDIGVTLEPTPEALMAGEGGRGAQVIESSADDAPLATRVNEALAGGDVPESVVVVWPAADTRQSLLTNAAAPSVTHAAALQRMQLDPRLTDAARRSRRDPRVETEPERPVTRFAPLATSPDGEVLLWGATAGDDLLLVLDARPDDPLALWTLRSATDALRAVHGWPRPSRPWTSDELAAHQRSPAQVRAPRLPDGLDTRWWWMAALAFLAVEQVWRRGRVRASADDRPTSTAA